MFCASYVYLFNLCWTGFTSPQPIVGRVYPSTLHSTRPKDGWTGPWMRQCMYVIECESSSKLGNFLASTVLPRDRVVYLLPYTTYTYYLIRDVSACSECLYISAGSCDCGSIWVYVTMPFQTCLTGTTA